MTEPENPLLEVEGLSVRYGGRAARDRPPTVNEVSFSIGHGETLALVGESGSGKSTIARAVLGLLPVESGRILLDGRDITHGRNFARVALDLQAVFQDPFSSLNPRRTVGDSLRIPLMAQGRGDREEAETKIDGALRSVGLPPDTARRYPAMFSGGQRQRIAIARALILEPRLIVCDEPTSSLDVSTQAAVLGLLRDLQEQVGASYLFITHDLAVVKNFADRVAVLNAGTVVESGIAAEVCARPTHPYTQRLLISAPVPDPEVQRQRREQRQTLIEELRSAEAAATPAHP